MPEIFAPGYKVCTSRFTDEVGEDTTLDVFGTSYASPVAAGSAALIRQYFTEGWYPCGSEGCSEPIKPSGALIKAVMLNGAQPVLGKETVFRKKKMTKPLKQKYFGKINLLKSLPLAGKNQINMFIVNNKLINQGEKNTINVRINKDGCSERILSATMSYYDMGVLACTTRCLQNNIDLYIERLDPASREVEKKFFPNDRKRGRDRVNNNERVQVTNATNNQTYSITVEAENMAVSDGRHYSLAMTGCFEVVQDGSYQAEY